MKFYGGADEGDRTMIDALQPALTSLLSRKICRPLSTPRKREPNEPVCRAKPMPVAHRISAAKACSEIWTPARTP
jgi:hypothetical protein